VSREREQELTDLKVRLKTKEFSETDILLAWLAIDELQYLRDFRERAFEVYPNLDMDLKTHDTVVDWDLEYEETK
jgi:hypothetical protein